MRQLNLVVDGVLIRCRGRLMNSDLSHDAQFPILLPTKLYFTDLIISHVRLLCCYAGVNHTLSSLRNKYWIPLGRQRVRSVLRQYVRDTTLAHLLPQR